MCNVGSQPIDLCVCVDDKWCKCVTWGHNQLICVCVCVDDKWCKCVTWGHNHLICVCVWMINGVSV